MAWRFSGSAAAAGLAMSSVCDTSRCRMIRSPAARRARPVSVMLDDAVGDVGHLGLGGAIGERDVGLDPVRGQGPPGELGVLGGHPQTARSPLGQVGQRLARRVLGDGQHDPDRVGGGLGVGQLAQRDDLAPPLLDPVAPGDAEVEQPVGDVDRDLLGPQNPHLADPVVVRCVAR